MKRRLVNILTALSLLLFVASCLLWARSYHVSDRLSRRGAGGWRAVWTARGHLVVGVLGADWSNRPVEFQRLRYDRDEARPAFNELLFLNHDWSDKDVNWQRGGFAWYEKRKATGVVHAIGVAPFWTVAAAAAALPVARLVLQRLARMRDRRRIFSGLCPSCGYDLRASVGRCPECGTDASLRTIA